MAVPMLTQRKIQHDVYDGSEPLGLAYVSTRGRHSTERERTSFVLFDKICWVEMEVAPAPESFASGRSSYSVDFGICRSGQNILSCWASPSLVVAAPNAHECRPQFVIDAGRASGFCSWLDA
eukprot:5836177-Amphidinium_carterae.1